MVRSKKATSPGKKEAARYLAPVPEAYVFWCRDGRILHDLNELAEALGSISEDTYVYHANAEKNDFVRWVEDIIADSALARELGLARDRGQAALIVTERLKQLKAH